MGCWSIANGSGDCKDSGSEGDGSEESEKEKKICYKGHSDTGENRPNENAGKARKETRGARSGEGKEIGWQSWWW